MLLRWWLALYSAGTLASAVVSPRVDRCDTKAWRRTIEQYSHRYPRAEAADLYKLTQQGIMGSEHAVADTAAAHAWMHRELATLSTSVRETLHENLSERLPPDGRFVRVNLRPYIAAGGDPATLVRAFVATANESKGDTAQFACVERALSDRSGEQAFSGLVSLIRERRKTNFDAARHSAAFQASYSPAYRVIRATLADSLLASFARPAPKYPVPGDRARQRVP